MPMVENKVYKGDVFNRKIAWNPGMPQAHVSFKKIRLFIIVNGTDTGKYR